MLKLRVFLFAFIFSTFTTFMPSRAMEMSREKFVVIGCVASLGLLGGLCAYSPVFKAYSQKFFQLFGFGVGKEVVDKVDGAEECYQIIESDRCKKNEQVKIQAGFETAFSKMIDEGRVSGEIDVELLHWEVCKDFLKKGANPNFVYEGESSFHRTTPLIHACRRKDMVMVKFLLECPEIDVNFSVGGMTPLSEACNRIFHIFKGFYSDEYAWMRRPDATFDIVELLLLAGANPNEGSDDTFGNSSLISALIGGSNKTVSLLLRNSANPNFVNKSGETALFYAGTIDKIKMLLEHKVDVNHRNEVGMSFLDQLHNPRSGFFLNVYNRPCTNEELKQIMPLFLQKGLDINAQDGKGNTTLHNILLKKPPMEMDELPGIIATFLFHGADAMVKNKKGETTLDCAKNDIAKRALMIGCLHNSAVKEQSLLLLGAKHANSRGIDEFDGEK